MKKLNSILTSSLFLLNSFFAPQAVQAQTKNWAAYDQGCVRDGVATIQGVSCMVANILSVSLTVIGLAGFIMLIVGSLRWLMSGGNTQNVDSARKTMTFAVIGLVIALSSFVIINLIAEFTGIDIIKQFFIPDSDEQWMPASRM